MEDGGNVPKRSIERLDVETEEERQNRIRAFLENLNSTSNNRNIASKNLNLPMFDFGNRSTYAVAPPTDLLSRVQAFLPQIEASNAILAQHAEKDPKSVDIEYMGEEVDRYIEMNLGLGIFEDRANCKREDVRNANASNSSDPSSEMDQDDTDSDYESDASSEIITSFLPARPMKPLPRRAARPQIIVLDEKFSSITS